MDDLDDVRAFLGYDKINIYGGSYGTRAGLVYLRQHGDHVRAAILDGVAPTNMRLPLFFPRDVQRALDLLIADCAADRRLQCEVSRPAEPPARADAAARKDPPTRRGDPSAHRRARRGHDDGASSSPTCSPARSTSPMASSLIPALIERAEQNDFQGLLALATIGGSGEPEHERRHAALGDLRGRRAEDHARRSQQGSGRLDVRAVRDAHAAGGVRVLAARHGRRGVLRAGDVRRCRRW